MDHLAPPSTSAAAAAAVTGEAAEDGGGGAAAAAAAAPAGGGGVAEDKGSSPQEAQAATAAVAGPGVGSGREAEGGDNGSSNVKRYDLKPESELRIEVHVTREVTVTLESGTAEIFGAELALNRPMVAVEGTPEVIYVGLETPMKNYIELHGKLETLRKAAELAADSSKRKGPRILLAGPTDVGKSTLSKILMNYCVRSGWTPTFVDLDIGQGQITIPGCLAATAVEDVIHADDETSFDSPLVFYYGHTTPSDNAMLYKVMLARLNGLIQQRFLNHSDPNQPPSKMVSSGVFINTMGWVDGLGYELLTHSIDVLEADIVAVIGQERLHSRLRQRYAQTKAVEVLFMPSSGGVVLRDKEFRQNARMKRVRDYFYGQSGEMQPHQNSLRFGEATLCRMGAGPLAPSSALPIGAKALQDPTKVNRAAFNQDLVNSVVAVSHATSLEEVNTANVAGFVHITEVDEVRGRVSFLAPNAGVLPSRFLLAGSIKWADQ